MKPNLLSMALLMVSLPPLAAETVVISSLPGPHHGLQPLTALDGIPLTEGTEIQVGSFPGLSDGQILNLASQEGMLGVTAAFVPFGNPSTIGQGASGDAGTFEIAVRGSGSGSVGTGETISLFIKTPASSEFLVARFPGKQFEAESETGLEPFRALHLGDAKLIVGNRTGDSKIATATAPSSGSFATWLAGFPEIANPALKLPDADADFDGLSNFLEYATGNNPASPITSSPCWIQPDEAGILWVEFKRVVGLGSIRYTLLISENLSAAWQETAGEIEPSPADPSLMRMRLSTMPATSDFYRLRVDSEP